MSDKKPKSLLTIASSMSPQERLTFIHMIEGVIQSNDDVLDEWIEFLSPAMRVVGVSDKDHAETVSSLVRIAQDTQRPFRQREAALAATFGTEEGMRFFEGLTTLERVEFSAPWVRPMIRLAIEAWSNGERANTMKSARPGGDLFPAMALGHLARSTPSEALTALVEKVQDLSKIYCVNLTHPIFEMFVTVSAVRSADTIMALGTDVAARLCELYPAVRTAMADVTTH